MRNKSEKLRHLETQKNQSFWKSFIEIARDKVAQGCGASEESDTCTFYFEFNIESVNPT